MQSTRACAALALGGAALLSLELAVRAAPAPDGRPEPAVASTASIPGGTGPDVVVSLIPEARSWGTADGVRAYSFGTVSCNVGTEMLSWRDGTDEAPDARHPVIAQNLFRLRDGRFVQLGQSWLKHAFCALDEDLCEGGCQTTVLDCDWLGVGCSDPYLSFTNGTQSNLGPKSEVNPVTGEFPFLPLLNPPFQGDAQARRLQVHVADLDPDARYFLEAHYVTADDAAAGNALNNASYREVTYDFLDTGQPQGSEKAFAGATTVGAPAIMAWAATTAGVTVTAIDVPGDGRLYVGSRAVDQGDGTWLYEYAIHNLNSDRAVGALAVPAPPDLAVIEQGFRDVDYHSGEVYDGTDWATSLCGGAVRWSTAAHDVDPLANALRWGTMYAFWLVADRPPVARTLRLSLFKPGSPATVEVAAVGPDGTPCPADCVCPPLGTVDVTELLVALSDWGSAGPCDVDGNGLVDIIDVLQILSAWGGCP